MMCYDAVRERMIEVMDTMERTGYVARLIDENCRVGCQKKYYKIKVHSSGKDVQKEDGTWKRGYYVIIQAAWYYARYEYLEEDGALRDTLEVKSGEYYEPIAPGRVLN